ESIFGLFGNSQDLDEEYQALIAQKFPVIEIDTKIPALQKVPDSYQVGTMPYIIAYNKNKEIWREMPSKQTSDIIQNLINQQTNRTQITFDNSAVRARPAVQPYAQPIYQPTVIPISQPYGPPIY